MALAAGAACVALRLAGAWAPEAVERLYARALFPWLVATLSALSALVPVSLAESAVALALVWLLARAARRLRRRRAGPAGHAPARSLQAMTARLAAASAVAYLAFLLVWGLNYDRLPLARTLALDARPASVDELAALGDELLRAAGRERVGLPEDAAGALRLRDGPRGALRRAPAGFARLAVAQPLFAGPARAPKGLLSSALFSRLGISGLYFPFTAEAHVNLDLPAAAVPFAACHEQAHQRGFAREDEASFAGFLACRAHGDADFRYSAAFEAAGDVLAALRPFAPGRARELAAGAALGLRRDWAALSDWLRRHEGPARAVSHAVNDAYLRSQGQAEGARSYGRVVDLLLAERRARLLAAGQAGAGRGAADSGAASAASTTR